MAINPQFKGVEEMTVDEKGRVAIPARFISVLKSFEKGEELHVAMMLGPDRSIRLMHQTVYDRISEEVSHLDMAIASERAVRQMVSMSDEVTLDKQNRAKLAPWMVRKLAIGKDVVMVGSGEFIEVFSAATFEQFSDYTLENYSASSEEVARSRREQQGNGKGFVGQ